MREKRLSSSQLLHGKISNALNAQVEKPLKGGASFSRTNRLLRLFWSVTWLLLCSWTPTPMHRFRVAVLKLFGAQIAWSAHVYGSARIWLPSNLSMGEHSCLGPYVNCYCMAPISLSDFAIVSQGSHLCSGSHDIEDPDFQLILKPIRILEGAWVASEAFVGPGVTIHASAVLGARGVLFKNAEANGVYVGNPAVFVRYRTQS